MLKIKVIFEHQYIRICVKLKVGGFWVQINFEFKISCRLFVLFLVLSFKFKNWGLF
jgi:hypothetical protein